MLEALLTATLVFSVLMLGECGLSSRWSCSCLLGTAMPSVLLAHFNVIIRSYLLQPRRSTKQRTLPPLVSDFVRLST